jgi:hypothetical protein
MWTRADTVVVQRAALERSLWHLDAGVHWPPDHGASNLRLAHKRCNQVRGHAFALLRDGHLLLDVEAQRTLAAELHRCGALNWGRSRRTAPRSRRPDLKINSDGRSKGARSRSGGSYCSQTSRRTSKRQCSESMTQKRAGYWPSKRTAMRSAPRPVGATMALSTVARISSRRPARESSSQSPAAFTVRAAPVPI